VRRGRGGREQLQFRKKKEKVFASRLALLTPIHVARHPSTDCNPTVA